MFQVQVAKFDKIITVENEWIKLIEFVKLNPFCEVTITFRNGKPDTAIQVKESIKF